MPGGPSLFARLCALFSAHRPARLRQRFLAHEEISALLTPGLRISALIFVLFSYFIAVFWPLHWKLPKQVRNQVEIAQDGHARFAQPGILRTYGPPDWLGDVVRGAPLRIHLQVVPAEPHPRFLGRLFALTIGSRGRLLTIDRDGSSLLIHLRGKGTNHDGAPPLRAQGIFHPGQAVAIDLALVGSRLTVLVDGKQVIRRDYPWDPRKRWNDSYRLTLGSDLNVRRYFLGEITRAEVTVNERSYDLLAPGLLSRPSRMFFLHREPRLNILQDLRTMDAYQNVAGFIPLGMVAALWPGATIFSVLATGLAVSGTIEFVQLTVPGRVPSVDDIVTNVTGAFLGWLVIALLRRLLDFTWDRPSSPAVCRQNPSRTG